MTVVIDTPDGPRRGSGVWSFQLRRGNIDQSFSSRFRGEAIPVELPNGKTVFALLDLRGPDNAPLPSMQGRLPEIVVDRLYGRLPGPAGSSRPDALQYIQQHYRSRVQLDCHRDPPVAECPLLVSFKNPMDPSTVYTLDPDNFGTELGRGYSLRGMFLQVTDDGPTRQLKDRLPWEGTVGGKHLDGSDVNRPTTLASQLTNLSFRQWD